MEGMSFRQIGVDHRRVDIGEYKMHNKTEKLTPHHRNEVCRGSFGVGEIDFGIGNRSSPWWGAAFLERYAKEAEQAGSRARFSVCAGN